VFGPGLRASYAPDRWRVTQTVAVGVVLLFAAELVVLSALGAASVRSLLAYLFLLVPEVMWPLAPFLHRDLVHLGSNFAMLVALAPVEARVPRRQFVAFLLVSAYVSTLLGAAWSLHFSARDFVAFYGVSGVVFAMAGYGLVASLHDRRRGVEPHPVLLAVGLALVGAVGFEIFRFLLAGPLGLNMSHVSGAVAGVVVGWAAVVRR
jgi:membrane associated rhomboid family serine protease